MAVVEVGMEEVLDKWALGEAGTARALYCRIAQCKLEHAPPLTSLLLRIRLFRPQLFILP